MPDVKSADKVGISDIDVDVDVSLLKGQPRQVAARRFAEAHARSLRDYVLSSGKNSVELIHTDLHARYRQMCQERGWRPRPWNPVAASFRRITTGHLKRYRWCEGGSGRVRKRVYPISRQ